MAGEVIVILDVNIKSQELERVAQALQKLPQVTDLYEVTGEYDLVALVETDSIVSFRNLLKNKILSIKGISGTNTLVIIHTHKRNGKTIAE
jgi:DNA-binding Lrp family transcriptional regulator